MSISKDQSSNIGKSFFAKGWKRFALYGLIGSAVWHYVHYTIEFNEKVRKLEDRRDMAYIHWLKKHFPTLRQYGIPYRESSVDKK
ncbi:unnamed protein product [Litomosoides sigmodontis]|uniref:Uncharacterized protein n=1 Tax=Litomosoides sigmodontis TaxID=42156 RepID=A0A3P6S488_LITSI|nr:unnamed protein product [Litomosoides sigmodontis]